MNYNRIVSKGVLVFALSLLSANVAVAGSISLNDILGKWCGTITNYRFTTTELRVQVLNGNELTHGPVLKIVRAESAGDELRIDWLDDKQTEHNTRFKLSGDRKSLIQLKE